MPTDLKPGDAVPELRVTPDKYLPHRYAGASGDFNPIHIDPRALKRLSVQFRGMGFPEQELVVSGTVKEAEGDRVVVDTVAAQGENQVIRNAEAVVHVP